MNLSFVKARPTQAHTALLTHGVSKARDTAGFPITTLTTNDFKFRHVGGGEDTIGVVLGYYLSVLLTHEQKEKAYNAGLYGITPYGDKYAIDGACGVRSMTDIASVAGWVVTPIYNTNRAGKPTTLKGFLFDPCHA